MKIVCGGKTTCKKCGMTVGSAIHKCKDSILEDTPTEDLKKSVFKNSRQMATSINQSVIIELLRRGIFKNKS